MASSSSDPAEEMYTAEVVNREKTKFQTRQVVLPEMSPYSTTSGTHSKLSHRIAARGRTPLYSWKPLFALRVIGIHKTEKDSEALKIFRVYPGHQTKTIPGLNQPGFARVIYCTDQAMANVFTYGNEEWAKAPELGELPDAPPRINSLWIPTEAHEYAPTAGVKKFREAESKCTYENVCVVPGGRASLSRVAAVIGDVYVGYQVPEYTTYSEVLSVFKRLVLIPTADIQGQGLSVVVASNPRNLTGEDLDKLLHLCKPHTTVILDEFYSWYVYPKEGAEYGKSLSAAAYVNDVNEDPVVIINGLTKNSRLPGWRTCCLQIAALPLLEPFQACQEKIVLQKHFHMKRNPVLKRLADMGLPVKTPPVATFYIWLDLSDLPNPLNNSLELLKEKTIVVPGIFFEINPAHRRDLFSSPCHHFVRISFGPLLADLDKGLDTIERVLERAREEGIITFGHSSISGAREPALYTIEGPVFLQKGVGGCGWIHT
ncbi:hypothetical protein BS47DRAFT_1374355 [Hydnum rufescens UP504]|uniref:Aminotransferase class I/classII large domain-containing protein n=1 Tax=Hydnum rufescens UP504 TaxID=1448309 RepID=A0A9P6AFK4_9AGAM|nr:hypothetical protein BS47DRAFT_1374355 [Hydnum rufescens UP504]